jgi:hypothetical protein
VIGACGEVAREVAVLDEIRAGSAHRRIEDALCIIAAET